MVYIPPGNVLSGVGGCVYVASFGQQFTQQNSTKIDIANWVVEQIPRNAECTHSGTWGAISRRRVAWDWRARIVVPLDMKNIPEYLLEDDGSVALRLNIGDPTLDPGTTSSGHSGDEQHYYFAPSGYLEGVRTILDAEGKDVIRQEAIVVGNSIMCILPDDNAFFTSYLNYLRGRGWSV